MKCVTAFIRNVAIQLLLPVFYVVFFKFNTWKPSHDEYPLQKVHGMALRPYVTLFNLECLRKNYFILQVFQMSQYHTKLRNLRQF